MFRPPPAAGAPSPSSEFHLGRRPWLDGLRGIAVLMVLGSHLGLLRGGSMGVDVFFVLSGFLITTLLVEEWRRTGAVSLKKFYLRRVLRLWPALFTLLAVHVASCWLWRPELAAEAVREAGLAAGHVANFPTVYGRPMPMIGHTWSLSLEEQFYLLWPALLGVLLARRTTPRGLLCIVAAGVAASAAWRLGLFYSQRWAGVEYSAIILRLYNGLDTRADSLLVGCGVGLIAAWGLLPRSRTAVRWSGVAAAGSAAGLAYLVVFSSEYLPIFWHGLLTVLALMVAAIIVRMLVAPPRFAAWLLELPPLVAAGRISYGLYLYHTLAFNWLLWFRPTGYGWRNPGMCIAAVGVSLAMALASYYMVERPFLRLKDRVARPPERPAAGNVTVTSPRKAA